MYNPFEGKESEHYNNFPDFPDDEEEFEQEYNSQNCLFTEDSFLKEYEQQNKHLSTPPAFSPHLTNLSPPKTEHNESFTKWQEEEENRCQQFFQSKNTAFTTTPMKPKKAKQRFCFDIETVDEYAMIESDDEELYEGEDDEIPMYSVYQKMHSTPNTLHENITLFSPIKKTTPESSSPPCTFTLDFSPIKPSGRQ